MKLKAEPPKPQSPTVDWAAIKAEILAHLDLAAEYRALGVRFVQDAPTEKGVLPCHALGREDAQPSAMVSHRTGIYHDSGSGESLNFWDFALKHGPFGRHVDVVRHYAEKAGVALPAPQFKSGGRIREATYLYRDETGVVLFAVFRNRLPNGKKSFSQHPPDGMGGWKFGPGAMDGVRLVPYRLPELIAADPAETVWFVEGEKDADRLAQLGLVATCNPMGAGKWRPEYAPPFAARAVVVLPDCDTPGRAHARAVCAALKPIARSIRCLELPDLFPKGDISDWLDAGGTIEELGRLAFRASEWEPVASPSAGPGGDATHGGDDLPPDEEVVTVCLSDVRETAVEWLFPDRIPFGKLTLLAGQQKLGKSFLTMHLAAIVSTGGQIPCSGGECVTPGSVVLLSAEDDLDDTIKPRLMLAGADTDKVHALTTIKHLDGTFGPFDLSHVPHLERAILRQGDTKLVIIDPVTQYVGSRIDDNKVAQLRALLGPLRELASRRKVAILVVTHLNKGSSSSALNRVLGSGAYTALARANWLVVKDPRDRKRRLMLNAGNNLAEDPLGLAYRIVDGRLEWEDEPIRQDADEFLQAAVEEDKAHARVATKVKQAADWLTSLFVRPDLEISSDEIFRMGNDRGFTRSTLFDAKKGLTIRAFKSREHNGEWFWKLDGDSVCSTTSKSSDGSTVQPGNLGDMEDVPF